MKIKNILISQPTPNGGSPYVEIKDKFNLNIDFVPFIRVEGLSAKDFRLQRIALADHTAVVFTTRSAIDSFFHLCEEMRVTIPETLKYFCMTEAVAFYLQKYIVYRLSLIHISEPTRLLSISYAVFCLKKKKNNKKA